MNNEIKKPIPRATHQYREYTLQNLYTGKHKTSLRHSSDLSEERLGGVQPRPGLACAQRIPSGPLPLSVALLPLPKGSQVCALPLA